MPDFLDKAIDFFTRNQQMPFFEFARAVSNDPLLSKNDRSYAMAAMFIHTYIQVLPDTLENRKHYKVPKQDVYNLYRQISITNGLADPILNTQFGRTIKRCLPALPEGRFTMANGKQTYCYCLVILKNPPALVQTEPAPFPMDEMNYFFPYGMGPPKPGNTGHPVLPPPPGLGTPPHPPPHWFRKRDG